MFIYKKIFTIFCVLLDFASLISSCNVNLKIYEIQTRYYHSITSWRIDWHANCQEAKSPYCRQWHCFDLSGLFSAVTVCSLLSASLASCITIKVHKSTIYRASKEDATTNVSARKLGRPKSDDKRILLHLENSSSFNRKCIFTFSKRKWTFQQDGAPSHTAKITPKFCKKNLPSFITKNEWPLCSTNLNPMDFTVWGYLEKMV